MIPPTPTPIPPGAPTGLNLSGMSLWEVAPEATQAWNMLPNTTTIQWVIVAALVVFLIWTAVTLFRNMSEDEA